MPRPSRVGAHRGPRRCRPAPRSSETQLNGTPAYASIGRWARRRSWRVANEARRDAAAANPVEARVRRRGRRCRPACAEPQHPCDRPAAYDRYNHPAGESESPMSWHRQRLGHEARCLFYNIDLGGRGSNVHQRDAALCPGRAADGRRCCATGRRRSRHQLGPELLVRQAPAADGGGAAAAAPKTGPAPPPAQMPMPPPPAPAPICRRQSRP